MWTEHANILMNNAFWHEATVPFIGDEIVRLRHDYADKPVGYGLVSQLFPSGRVNVVRVFPDKDTPAIISLPIPQLFKDESIITYYLSFKNSIFLRQYEIDWSIYIDIWT